MQKRYLMAPGPTPVPESVSLRMAHPAMHHRTPQFSEIFARVEAGLQYLFQTKNDVLMLASSGSGAMEGSVINFLCRGEKALVVNGGKFGERWGKIAQAYGLEVVWINSDWGVPVNPDDIAVALKNDPSIGGVFIQACDTSATVAHPIREVGEIVRQYPNVVYVVDGITAVGVADLAMDRDGIDVLVVGSQKALMLPPGLACVGVSEKAWQKNSRADLPRFYFDFKKERKALADQTTAYTPTASLIIGLDEVLEMIRQETLPVLFARHDILARATRAGLEALGLKLLAPQAPALSCTGAFLPESVDGKKFVKYVRDTMGVTFAGGQDHLTGKIIRINHMGYVDTFDVVISISAMEMALDHFGYSFRMGDGVSAAQKILQERYQR